MVTNRIYSSGNNLAGYSVEYNGKGFKGIRDFSLIEGMVPDPMAGISWDDTIVITDGSVTPVFATG